MRTVRSKRPAGTVLVDFGALAGAGLRRRVQRLARFLLLAILPIGTRSVSVPPLRRAAEKLECASPCFPAKTTVGVH
jgi:hypothetical protein